ncbi:MAG TPA: GNAT family N-acetyltransferase [Burkholderiales bacterium]|nr:GNAT family N-acetyltransferase [Burkholderiales bacterium]
MVRDWARGDKSSLVRYANNRNVWRNLTDRFPHPYTDADAEAWFALLEGMPEPSHWAIEVDGEAVGAVGCILGKGMYARAAQFGYWLGEPFWGRGIMTAAVCRIAPYAMERFNLVRLQSPVFAWNVASMRVLEKCGFTREARLKLSALKGGQLIDELIYALVDTTRS